jgi:hypothetical protein
MKTALLASLRWLRLPGFKSLLISLAAAREVARSSKAGARGSRSTVERIVLSGVRRSNSEGMKYTERHSIL